MTTLLDSFISLDELVGLDSVDTLVVTVNNRYARRIVTALSGYVDSRHGTMPMPDVVPFSAWLRHLGGLSCFSPDQAAPLNRVDTFGAHLLWEQAIDHVEAGHVLLAVPHAARHAMDADRLMSDWLLHVDPYEETDDYRRFRLWRQHYHDMLAQRDAEDDNQEYARIVNAVASEALPFTLKTVVLAGFNEFSPRQRRLFESFAMQGVRVLQLRARVQQPGSVAHMVADDADTEWRMAAQWAATQLHSKPQGRFAIIAPGLETDAAFAHRVLRDALRLSVGHDAVEAHDTASPDFICSPAQAAFLPVQPYNVAVARPLANWFHVRAALAWLRLLLSFSLQRQCRPDIAGPALIMGACAGDTAESSGRVVIDVAWRRKGIINLTQGEFTDQLSARAPVLHAAWCSWLERADDCSQEASASRWVALFRQWLQCIGFPGHAVLDSHAYQALDAFDDMLTHLARQDPVVGPVSVEWAFALLRRLALETLFQPQRDPDSRLDVLGLLESEGGQWDGVWVLGLTDDTLPAAPSPNPFIPLPALRRAQAPRATPERELEWAKNRYDALLVCADQIRLSHPRQEGERELRPSPFLESIPVDDSTLIPRRSSDNGHLEHVVDDKGPAMQSGQKTRGGIGVIDTQARNPLWAFVKYRLGAADLGNYAGIYDQNARGLFLHEAIEQVWRMLDDQATLLDARANGRLGTLIEQSVGVAGDKCLKNYGPILRALESARAIQVLNTWLDRECDREPFSIAGLEKDCSWSFGALDLSLRIDRIDKLADESLAIIDYKSGIGPIDPKSNWMRRQPVGLQLPFYAAVLAQHPNNVTALVLARLHARKVETKGLSQGDCGFPSLAQVRDWPLFADYTWEDLMQEWRSAIDSLASAYVQGVATNVTEKQSDLDYCDVQPFLRRNEEPHEE